MTTRRFEPNLSTVLLATTLLLAPALAGCTTTDEEGSVAFFVKDKPVHGFDKILVSFTRVEIEGKDKVVVFEGNDTVDLLAFSALTAKERLGVANAPPGDYKKIRIDVSRVVAMNGTNATELKLPSGVLRLKVDFSVVEGEETQILCDFDLDRSVVVTTNPPHFKPVVKAIKTNKADHDKDGTPDIEDADAPGVVPEEEGATSSTDGKDNEKK